MHLGYTEGEGELFYFLSGFFHICSEGPEKAFFFLYLEHLGSPSSSRLLALNNPSRKELFAKAADVRFFLQRQAQKVLFAISPKTLPPSIFPYVSCSKICPSFLFLPLKNVPVMQSLREKGRKNSWRFFLAIFKVECEGWTRSRRR